MTSNTPPIDPARNARAVGMMPGYALSTHAIKTSETGRGMRIARNVDLIFLAVALPCSWRAGCRSSAGSRRRRVDPPARAARLPGRRAKKADDPREMVGYLAGSMIGRGWIVALIIFGVGLATEDAVGLSAAVLFVFTFTFYLTVSMITRPFDGEGIWWKPQPRGGNQPGRSRTTTADRPSSGSSSPASPACSSRSSASSPRSAPRARTRRTSRRTSSSSTRGSRSRSAALDMSINKAVLYLFIAAVLTTGTMIYVAKRMEDKPNMMQTAVEAAYDLTNNNITRGNMGSDMAAKWFPFIATLFLFILVLEPDRLHPAADEHRAQVRAVRARDPVVRAVRRDGQHLGAARADAHRLDRLPRRGRPGARRQGLPRELGARGRRGPGPRSRSSSSRSSRTSCG